MIGAQVGLLATVTFAVTGIATAVLTVTVDLEQPAWVMVGTFVAALSYGLFGVLIGVLFDRLSGMYLVLFAPLLDIAVFQNPMYTRGMPSLWVRLLPGYYPLRIVQNAAFGCDVHVSMFALALVPLATLWALAVGTFYRTTRIS